jgi:hypothetical protein
LLLPKNSSAEIYNELIVQKKCVVEPFPIHRRGFFFGGDP